MFKKVLGIISLLLASMSCAYAGLYLGPMVSYESLTSGTVGYEGFSPKLLLGYDTLIKNTYYLGAEASGTFTSIPRNNNTNAVASLRTTYGYGVSLIPGIVMDAQLMGYIRIGLQYNHFSNLNTTQNGYQRGVGLQVMLDNAWAVRGEYDYVKYQAFSKVSTVGEDQYSIGLIYWFS